MGCLKGGFVDYRFNSLIISDIVILPSAISFKANFIRILRSINSLIPYAITSTRCIKNTAIIAVK